MKPHGAVNFNLNNAYDGSQPATGQKMTKLNKSLHFFIFSLCLVFTIYQSINCVNKYLDVPESTSKRLLNLHEIEASEFPAITLCSRNDSAGKSMKLYSGFSEEKLKECGINRGYTFEKVDFTSTHY